MDFNIKPLGVSVEQFRNNPKLQIEAAANLANQFKSQFTEEDRKLAKEKGYNENALLAGAWLGGVKGVRKVLKGQGNPSDKHWSKEGKGTTVKDRMDKFNKMKEGGVLKFQMGGRQLQGKSNIIDFIPFLKQDNTVTPYKPEMAPESDKIYDARYVRPKRTKANENTYKAINPANSYYSDLIKNSSRWIFNIERNDFPDKKAEDSFNFYLHGERDRETIPDLKEKPKNFNKLQHPTYGIPIEDMYRINRDIVSQDTNELKEEIRMYKDDIPRLIQEGNNLERIGEPGDGVHLFKEAKNREVFIESRTEALDSIRQFLKNPTRRTTFREAYTNPQTWKTTSMGRDEFITPLNYLGRFRGNLTSNKDSLEVFDTHDYPNRLQSRLKGTPYNVYSKVALKDIAPSEENDIKYRYNE